MRDAMSLALHSLYEYPRLTSRGKIHMDRDGLREPYFDYMGGMYMVFRKTSIEIDHKNMPVVLVVGFRLKLLRNSRFLHWLFKRASVLTTPFWSGIEGFKTKLWMSDPFTNNYIGIYDWRGIDSAKRYLDGLIPLLKKLSVRGSVWYEVYNQELDNYLVQNTADLYQLKETEYIMTAIKGGDASWQKAIQNT